MFGLGVSLGLIFFLVVLTAISTIGNPIITDHANFCFEQDMKYEINDIGSYCIDKYGISRSIKNIQDKPKGLTEKYYIED